MHTPANVGTITPRRVSVTSESISFLCRSFAYLTVRDRLPTILTKVIDTIHRNKNKFFEEYGQVRIVLDSFNLSCFHWLDFFLELIWQPKWYLPVSYFTFIQEGIRAEKQTIALLSKMRNELLTDKPVLELADELQDTQSWNLYLQRQQDLQGDQDSVSWFKSPWLYVECYMYRRVQEALWLKWELFSLVPFAFLLTAFEYIYLHIILP